MQRNVEREFGRRPVAEGSSAGDGANHGDKRPARTAMNDTRAALAAEFEELGEDCIGTVCAPGLP